MTLFIQRAFPRHHYEAPIRYAGIDSDHFLDSRMYNYSQSGIYFEPRYPLSSGSDLKIVMMNYSPGAYGPEGYRAYVARVKWCKDAIVNRSAQFGVGAQLMARSHYIEMEAMKEIRFTCDLCGRFISHDEVNQIDNDIYLCPDCFNHLKRIPEGSVKSSIERFMMGNVV